MQGLSRVISRSKLKKKKKTSGINDSTHPWLMLHLQELKGAAQSSRRFLRVAGSGTRAAG